MIISKKLSRLCLAIVSSIFLIETVFSEEKVENIWEKIETKKITNENSLEEKDKNKLKTIQGIKIKLADENIIVNNNLENSQELLAGLFDPAENDLNLDMWSNSDGKEIKTLLKKINTRELSNFSEKIMDIALLTNSYLPKNDITPEEFQNFTIDHLIKKKRF